MVRWRGKPFCVAARACAIWRLQFDLELKSRAIKGPRAKGRELQTQKTQLGFFLQRRPLQMREYRCSASLAENGGYADRGKIDVVDNVDASCCDQAGEYHVWQGLDEHREQRRESGHVLSAADQSSPAALNKAQTTPAMTTTSRTCFHSGQLCQGIWNALPISPSTMSRQGSQSGISRRVLLKELTNLLEDLLHGGLPGAAGDFGGRICGQFLRASPDRGLERFED